MFEETAESLYPASDARYIMADRFGPEMAGKCALTRVGRCSEGGRVFSLLQGLFQDGLDVIGEAKDVYFRDMGIQGVVYWAAPRGGGGRPTESGPWPWPV